MSADHSATPMITVVTGLALLWLSAGIPTESWPLLGCVGAFVYALLMLQGTNLEQLGRRFAAFVPLLLTTVIGLVLVQPRADIVVWGGVLLLRCCVAFLIGLWMMERVTGPTLLLTLQRCRVPLVLVAIVDFTLRYLALLWEESERMSRAQRARAGGPRTAWHRWRHAVERLGLLLLRALDRAERTHRAMLARHWDGTVRMLESPR
jgi:cobalt/nickel transport system permease protein